MAAEVEAVVGVAEVVAIAKPKVKVPARTPIGGPTSPRVLIILPVPSVKNITFLGKVLTGVKNLPHVLGKTILHQKTNETGASLISMTYKKICIQTQDRKYIQPV